MIEPVGVANKFGNETVGPGHYMRLLGLADGRQSQTFEVGFRPRSAQNADADASARGYRWAFSISHFVVIFLLSQR